MSATRKKPPARAPEETRSKLVEAAGRLFNSVGYFGTDSNRIAREAGYAPGTFYVHFADKREIFLEVYRGWVSSEWQAIAAAIAPEKGAAIRSQSLRIAKAVLRHHREWRMFRKSLRALTVTDERVHQARVAERARQIAQTAELLRARGVTQTPARIYANLLLFEILCDAVADGDTATLGLKERDILARLAADVDALLEAGRAKPRMARANRAATLGSAAFNARRGRAARRSRPPELLAQFDLRLLQRPAAARGQIPAGAIDVEDQHRQRRAVRLGLAAMALLSRALERSGDALGVFPGEDAAFQIERTAFARDAAGPGAGRIAPCRLRAPRLSLRRFTPARLPGCRVAAHGLSASRGASHAVLPTCGPLDVPSSRRSSNKIARRPRWFLAAGPRLNAPSLCSRSRPCRRNRTPQRPS